MKLGVTFPQLDFGADAEGIRAYAQAAQDLGYGYLLAYDHVLGADVTNRPGWSGYTHADSFHEPFVLFAFMSAAAPKLEFVTGVIILPQRQTVLVAKQAAEVDILTGGKFRLGIGVGWNRVEFEGLNEEFADRGKRVEEQVELMRRLWTEPVITFEGQYHRVTDAGLNPLPIQRPIPVWIGGSAEPALKRAETPVDIVDGPPADGYWDRLRLEQVVTNLLTNAMRYGGKRPVTVSVSKADDQVRLAVRDQGIGIAQDAQRKIFDRFERSVSADEVSGLGLGLYITKQIVEAHAGKIWVESDGPNKGSTFFVELPTNVEQR